MPENLVTVRAVDWHGDAALTLTYRDDRGRVGEAVLFRDDEHRLSLENQSRIWSFDADGHLFRLVSEARRIQLAYLFDPYLAITTSNIDPLPHQISAVYGEMLPRHPLRFLLADDPGAGKTIMAGLFMKELILRGDLARGLVVAPGSLVEQWQDELYFKFGLSFEILTRETIESSLSGNPFEDKSLLICRLDQLARNDDLLAKLQRTDWDIVVCDEAHKMSAHWWGNELKKTRRYRLGEILGSVSRHFLLMTATPHSGKEDDFQAFLALLDADRFEGRPRTGVHTIAPEDLMRRLVKERLLKFDGRPLFPERRAYTVRYALSDLERALYDEVSTYVREEMNRVDRLDAEGNRRVVVGFALTTLQRRLASSPEAIYQSLSRRRKRLESRLRETREASGRDVRLAVLPRGYSVLDLEDVDELLADELEELEEEVVDQASAARTAVELEAEIAALARLETLAGKLRVSGTDRKWEELAELLQSDAMFEPSGTRRKIIIFTEHRDTLTYLASRVASLVERPDAVVVIHGAVHRDQRRAVQELFMQDKDTHVLIATDAAGEGINLQRAHLMVNYDLPWNPGRIEQRFGRIHRIGQTEVCHLWNLVAEETREGEVFARLFEKLNAQRDALGDQVFDVLGEAFTESPLRELLLDAVRYGERPDVRARLDSVIDATVGANLSELIRERALASDVLGGSQVAEIREEMERAIARRLQPHFVRAYFSAAFAHVGGSMREREQGRYEVARVPADVRNRDRQIGTGAPVLRSYERVTFDKELIRVRGTPHADFLTPGHPLMESVTDLVLQRHGSLLKKGAILVDDAGGEHPKVLLYLEHSIQDARSEAGGGQRVVSRRFEFIEVDREGQVAEAGYAPFLDLRPADAGELEAVQSLLAEDWLATDITGRALQFAIAEAIPKHLAEVRTRTTERVVRTLAAVKERLSKEIEHWELRARRLREEEERGTPQRMNWRRAEQRAEGLRDRLRRRLAELQQEKQLSPKPPIVVGGALVVPVLLLERLMGRAPVSAHARDTEEVDRRAVDAVLGAERTRGRIPREMPHSNPGYDVESKDPATGDMYFIEVKGRIEGADIVTVKKTQILTGLNRPDHFILALVRVPTDRQAAPEVRYVRSPFSGTEETYFNVTSVNYEFGRLFAAGHTPSAF